MRRRVLFFIERNLHYPVLAPLWKFAQKELGYYCKWFGPLEFEGCKGGISKNLFNYLINIEEIEFCSAPCDFKPDITFVADHSFHQVESLGFIVNVGHGTISKGYYFLEEGLSYRENLADLICVPGDFQASRLSKCMVKPIEVTGMPKLDLQINSEERDRILQKYSIDPNKKILLVAPTFNPELSLLPFLEEDMNKYFFKDFEVLLKLHGAVNQKYKDMYRGLRDSRFHLIEEDDITPFFSLAHILISDVSSVIYEFSSFGKPIVLFDSPYQKDFFQFQEGLIEYDLRDIGKRIKQLDLLPLTLEELKDDFVPDLSYKKISHGMVFKDQRNKASELVWRKTEEHLSSISKRGILFYEGDFEELDACTKAYLQNRWYCYPFDVLNKKAPFYLKLNNKKSSVCFINLSIKGSPNYLEALYVQHLLHGDIVVPMLLDSYCGNIKDIQHFGDSFCYLLPGKSIGYQQNRSPLLIMSYEIFNSLRGSVSFQNKLFYWKSNTPVYVALDHFIYFSEATKESVIPIDCQQNIFVFLFSIFASQPNQHEGESLKLDDFLRLYRDYEIKECPSKKFRFAVDLGSAFFYVGEYTKALKSYESCLEIKEIRNPELLGRLYFHLGKTLKILSRLLESKKYLEKCLECVPTHGKAKELVKEILRGNGL